MRKLDHIVWAVPKLDEGISIIEKNLGVSVLPGGRHLEHGTHNALIILDNGCYLEIIAQDPASSVNNPWMAVSDILIPTITRVSIKAENLENDASVLAQFNPKLKEILIGERIMESGNKLNWRMTRPSIKKGVDPTPFYLEWKGSTHPTTEMPIQAIISEMIIYTPNYKTIKQLYEESNVIIKKSEYDNITLTLQSENGKITI